MERGVRAGYVPRIECGRCPRGKALSLDTPSTLPARVEVLLWKLARDNQNNHPGADRFIGLASICAILRHSSKRGLGQAWRSHYV